MSSEYSPFFKAQYKYDVQIYVIFFYENIIYGINCKCAHTLVTKKSKHGSFAILRTYDPHILQ